MNLRTTVPVHVLKGDLGIHRPALLQLLGYRDTKHTHRNGSNRMLKGRNIKNRKLKHWNVKKCTESTTSIKPFYLL